jgi:hypothetical protein
MHRILLLLCLIVAMPAARAADSATSGPNADTTPLQQAGAPAQPAGCPMRPRPTDGAPSNIIVELDPDTLWRPCGAEVRFTIRGPGARSASGKSGCASAGAAPTLCFSRSTI